MTPFHLAHQKEMIKEMSDKTRTHTNHSCIYKENKVECTYENDIFYDCQKKKEKKKKRRRGGLEMVESANES